MTAVQREAFDKIRELYVHGCDRENVREVFEAGWDAAPKPSRWSPHRPTKVGLYAYKADTGVQGVLVLIQEDRDGLYTRGFGLMPVEPAVVHRVYRPRSWPDGFWFPVQECGGSTIDF